jgi:septation ring formation regulator EzrA
MIDEIEQQLDSYERQVKAIPNAVARIDLMKMIGACRALLTELSKEAINCRRHNRPSLRYHELISQYETQIDTFEGFLIQASLTYL